MMIGSELQAGTVMGLGPFGGQSFMSTFKGYESLWSKGRLFLKMATKILPLWMVSYCLAM